MTANIVLQGVQGAPAINPAAGGDIRGLHGPLEIPAPFPWPELLVALSALGVIVWWCLRAREKRRASTPRSALEQVHAELKAAEVWLMAGLPRGFAIATSDAVRTWLQRRFDLAVTNRTTEEFLADLRADPPAVLAAHRDELEAFLAATDRVKYAAGQLGRPQMRETLAAARRLVEATAAGHDDEVDAHHDAGDEVAA